MVGWLLVDGDPASRCQLHPAVVVNIAEDQVTALVPPERAFRRAAIASVSAAVPLYLLVDVEDILKIG